MRFLKLLVTVISVIVCLVNIPIAVTGAEDTSNNVSMTEANQVASYYVASYADTIQTWQNARVGGATEYYADDKISAYEFKVLKEEQEAGFILISARKDWMPVLEFGSGSAPSSRLEKAKEKAKADGYLNQDDTSQPQYYYGGALSYYVQIGDKMKQSKKMVDMINMRIVDKPDKIELKMDKELAKDTWDKLLTKLAAGSPSELILNGDMEYGNPPVYWTLEGSGASYSSSSFEHSGTSSLALTRSGANCAAYQVISGFNNYSSLQLDVWVWASEPNSVRLTVVAGAVTWLSEYHTGNSAWQLLTINLNTISESTAQVKLTINNINTTAYFDDAILPSDESWGGYYALLSSTDVCDGQFEVPAYHQSSLNSGYGDDGGVPGEWPSYIGDGADPWYAWDGCTPISGAMILGHWRNRSYSGISTNENALIDVNHHYMGTGDSGLTTPDLNANGLRESANYYNYSFYTVGGFVDWDDMTSEVNADRPFILTVWDIDFWNGHSIAAKGYADDGTGQQFIHANNTWNTASDYYIQYDTWTQGWQTKAIPDPLVSTGAATNVGTNSATLNGNLDNLGGYSVNDSVYVWFEWGTTTSYGNETSPLQMTATGSFTADITGLSPSTSYHFKAVAIGDYLESYGDDKQFTTPATLTLGEAVDNTSLTWTTGGNANWFGQTTTSFYGGDAAQSGAITHNQSTSLNTNVSGPSNISFYWKVSSESGWDFLNLQISGG